MVNRGELLSDVEFCTPRFEGVIGKLLAIVTNNDAGKAEAANNVLPDKLEDVAASDGSEWSGFDPLSKVVNGND